MQLSVIIVNYNVRPFLENALTSVRKASRGIAVEIIVVDNASADGSVQMVRQSFPEVTLIVNEQNRGFGAANNQAMRRAGGEYFLLLNPDTIVQENTFAVMLEFFRAHPEAGMAGCKVLNPDGTLQLACRRSFPTPWVAFTKVSGLSTILPSSSLFGRYNLTYRNPDENYEVDAVSGSFMFLRREVWEQTNGFDEQFFMYGEDLDLCYRVQRLGWKVYYVHETQIIHYKGESARRSDIDEVKHFYEAMRVFVQKHLQRGKFSDVILRTGIAMREWIAFLGKVRRPLVSAVIDLFVIDAALLLAEYLWFGQVFRLPASAYPITLTVPWFIITATMYFSGVYTSRKHSLSRAANSVVVGYVIIAALVFFFKQYGFSRMITLIAAAITVVALPGWRLLVWLIFRSPEARRQSLFGRRTLIVGAGETAQKVLQKLRLRVRDGYEIVGFIDTGQGRVGDEVGGVEILGTIDNINKVAQENRISEVIFATESLTYTAILSIIARTRDRSMNYRLVPTSLEVIIGKTHIDELDDLPLVEIEYNLHKPLHRLIKRVVDLWIAGIGFCFLYPVLAAAAVHREPGRFGRKVLALPRVLRGELSLVGPPMWGTTDRTPGTEGYWGKPGLTGLPQINYRNDLTFPDIEQYNIYYAKNQSLWLDMEILLKSILLMLKH